ncbi:MAG: HAD family hydrolase [Bacteroidales bacterium]|nr:HAD family hydrolase [Bacteroidales bacterium]
MTALFLDRDGVINQRIVDGYVTRPDDFLFIDGVLEAMAIFARHFDRIFVVTNQQGIGKGLMTEADLQAVHSYMLQQVQDAGGRIDRIYHCPTLKSEHSFMRKPSIGMALRARRDYSDVVLHRSVMVGDMESDMLFGRRARMQTVLVDDQTNLARRNPHLVDLSFPNLISYAQYLEKVTSE